MWSSLSWIGCCPASTHSPWPNNHGMAPVILNSLGISQVLFGNQYFNLATMHWCLLDEIYLCSLTTSWRSFLESPSTDEHLIKFYSQEDSRNTFPFPLPKRINSAFTFLEGLSIAHLCQASQVGRLYEPFGGTEHWWKGKVSRRTCRWWNKTQANLSSLQVQNICIFLWKGMNTCLRAVQDNWKALENFIE